MLSLLPGNQEIGPGDKRILSRLRSDFAVKRDDGTFKWKVPLVAIVTKIDELSRDGLINKLIEINEFADFTDIVPVSALKHDNLAEVKNVLIENMPEGPQMYPAEQHHRRASGRNHCGTGPWRFPGRIG